MPTNVYEFELVCTMIKDLNRKWKVPSKVPDLWQAFLKTNVALSGKISCFPLVCPGLVSPTGYQLSSLRYVVGKFIEVNARLA